MHLPLRGQGAVPHTCNTESLRSFGEYAHLLGSAPWRRRPVCILERRVGAQATDGLNADCEPVCPSPSR